MSNSPTVLAGKVSLPSSQQGFIGKRPVSTSSLLAHEATALLANALDEIACGVIIVDPQRHLQHANLAGQALLQRGHLLESKNSVLSAKELADTPKLTEAMTKALHGKRSMLTLGAQAQTTVAVVPLDRHADRTSESYSDRACADTATQASPRTALIALIFSRTGMCEALMMSFFSRAHNLTRAEEQILSLLCVGHTAPEMAQQLRVGEATIRTHIRSICQKTHSNGIREVTKRLALLPPLMAAVMPSAFA